jgi:hypothetical protein
VVNDPASDRHLTSHGFEWAGNARLYLIERQAFWMAMDQILKPILALDPIGTFESQSFETYRKPIATDQQRNACCHRVSILCQ